MPHIRSDLQLNDVPLVRLESDFLQIDVAPSVGGRIISIIDKKSGHEFLWRDRRLTLKHLPLGSAYDPNFYGGIDELLPNDIPESVVGLSCVDHGELWTTALDWNVKGEHLHLRGQLPIYGLVYEREMSLLGNGPCLELNYRITNPTSGPRPFLWKMHAAVAIQPGDRIDCPAARGQVVDLAWSRYHTLEPFPWPIIESKAANVIPENDGTTDFFYLSELSDGRMAWHRPKSNLTLEYRFDLATFPYAWLFASYGGLNGDYTVVLEPCTAMPLSLNEAAARKQCALLAPGQTLETRVELWAGATDVIEQFPRK